MCRVFFEPYTEKNPYQRRLASALEIEGVDVVGGQKYWFLPQLLASRARIVHFHWLTVFFEKTTVPRACVGAGLYAFQLLIIRLMGIQVVWTAHNLRSHEQKFPRIDAWVTALTVRMADRIIVHCEWAKQELLGEYPDLNTNRVAVTPHPSYLGCYPNEVEATKARSLLGVGKEGVVLLFLGAVREYKGVIELLETYSSAGFGGDALLLIVGKPYSSSLKNRIEAIAGTLTNVRLDLRFVPDREVQYYMQAADVVVLPYKHIFTSGAALLAMGFGKPIIAPRIGCMGELLDSAGAFLYEASNPEGLMQSLRRAVRERAKLLNMGRYNLARARGLTWEDMAAKTASIYRECLDGIVLAGGR